MTGAALPHPPAPDSDDTLAQSIACQLRREILRGTLPPATPIKERDNAARLGVSRTPLREAIRILSSEGLVQLRPLRSPIVADPPFAEIADQISVLQMLEVLAAEQACTRATPSDLSAIAGLKDRVEQLYGTADPLDVFEADMQFHAAITAASHNAALVATHREYMQRLWRARYLSSRRRTARTMVIAQHDAILAALIDRDMARIRADIIAHTSDMLQNIRDHFQASAIRLADSKDDPQPAPFGDHEKDLP